MRAVGMTIVLALIAGVSVAQAPAVKMFASSSDIASLMAKAKADRKGNQPTVIEPILRLAPYGVNLEYRSAVGPAAVHEKEAEMFYVLDGSATMTTGGKLAGEKRTNAENLTGTGIEGGMSREISKGDVLIVPQGVPHWVSKINGTVVLMSMHVPRTQ